MRLLRMILRGFKSFAETTEIEFSPGVTAIVGPNGSGKSNIADAVRWVLGEQNIRQLRGEKSADIIFAGTETERARASAEVTLVFDNADGTLQPEMAEVSVTRRLLRSGDSEYFINKRACRLKDIHMLFADTGLGKDSMAVIGQNQVDRILVGKPEERKLIFEEVAGISGFKLRKAEGLRKLAEAERNMIRIHDVATVLATELEPMAKRAEETKKYLAWQKEKKELTATLAWQKYRSAQKQLTRAENDYLTAEQAVLAAQSALAKAEAERQEHLRQTEEENVQLRNLERTAAAAEKEQERLSGEYGIVRESEKYASKRLAEDNAALASLQAQAEELAKALAAAREAVHTAESGLQAALAEEERTEREVVTSQADQERYLASERAREQAAAAHRERLADYASSRQSARRNAEWLAEEIEKIAAHSEEMAQEKAKLASKIKSDEELYAEWEYDRQDRKERLAYKEEQLAKLKQREEALLKKEREREQRLRVVTDRCAYLERLAAEHEGFGRATKWVLDANEPWRQNCYGTVAELLDVPARYTTAIDIALGGAQQHLVVKDAETAQAAVRYLQRKNGGRTTFYPLRAIQPRGLAAQDAGILREDGVIGTADNLVRYDLAYRDVVNYLLARTVIVQDMDTARRLAKAYRYRVRMVTLDGQLFQAGGSVTGGSTRKAELTFFGRKQELAKLREEASRLRVPQAVEWPDTGAAEAEVETLREAIREADLKLATLAARLEEVKQYAVRQEKEWASLRADQETKEGQKSDALQEVAAWEEKAERERAEFILPELAAMPDDNRLREWQEKLTQCRVAVAELRVRHEQALQAENTAAQNEAKNREEVANVKQRREEESANVADLRVRAEKLRGEYDQAAAAAQEKRAACEAYYAAKEERFAAGKEAEAAYEKAQAAERAAQITFAGLTEKRARMNAECEERLRELQELGYTETGVQEVLRKGNMSEIREQLAAVEEAIAALGPINPQAVEEYEAARERHELYTTQLADLQASRDKLQQVVKDIDRTMNRQFREAFAVVAEEFQRIFTHLFGGGTAKLEIVRGEEDGIGGVEIYIQPPGKKQQPLTLLSGGERALTVIALLFSFMAYRPAPFCLVDEVDAALDDANVERFRNYLRDGRKDMQFIVITHRKATMEAASVLQGVTMERKGISKMIAVDLQRYEEV